MSVDVPTGRRRVVVTGCGVVTPVGLTVEEFWAALLAGRSGIGPIGSFDTAELPVHIAGEVRDFDPDRWMPRPVSRRTDTFAQYALAAAVQAAEQAGLGPLDERTALRTATIVGSGYGAENLIIRTALKMDRQGPRSVSPFYAATSGIDSAAGEIALRYGARGPSAAMSTACATGATCIGEAGRLIRLGVADVAFAGAADHCINALDMAASARTGALSTRNEEPERASRPFDRGRDGFVMSAGAGVVVLEEAEHAARRGATVLAELVGYGASTDAHHVTAPHPEGLGAKHAMALALDDAGIKPSDVDYVNAHGTSTPLNDRVEAAALRAVLGGRATEVPISSIKSLTGHMIGAAGAVEFVATVLALRTGIVPPTANCDDPEFDDLDFVPHRPKEWPAAVAMSNSFGFGGHNAVLVARRWTG